MIAKASRSKSAAPAAILAAAPAAQSAATVVKLPKGSKPVTKGSKAAAPAVTLMEPDRVYRVAPTSIKVEQGYNVREFNFAANRDDRELRGSIEGNPDGVVTPLTVRQEPDGTIYVVAGHRRLAAALSLQGKSNVATVPVMLAGELVREHRSYRDVDLMVSNLGKPLTPIERAQVAKRMHADGYTAKAIASLGGFVPRYAEMLLAMADWPQELQTIVAAETIAAETVQKLIQKLDVNAAMASIKAAILERGKKVGFGGVVKLTPKHFPILAETKAPADKTQEPADKPEEAADKPETPEVASDKPETADKPEEAADKPEEAADKPVEVATHKRGARQSNGTKTDDTPLVSGAPVTGSKLAASGQRILRDGKQFVTVAGNDAETGRANTLTLLKLMRDNEGLFI